MLKRKASSSSKAAKRTKSGAAALSKPEITESDDDAAPVDGGAADPAPAAAAAAAAASAPPAKTLKDGIRLLNDDEAAKVSGRTRSLHADAKAKPIVTLEGMPGSGDPYLKLVINKTSVLPVPAPNKQQDLSFETPVFPVGFIDLDPVRAVVKNNNPETNYRKQNSADVVATVNVDGEELAANPDYESSGPGMALLYHLSSDIFCKPSHANVYPEEHIQKHRTAALGGDDAARGKFVAAAMVEANRTRGPPYLPCQASEAGAYGTSQDTLKAGDMKRYKMTTKFFTFPGKDVKGTGPHQPSIELARKLGGDDVEELVAVLQKEENWGRQLKLVPIYDEHMKPVPVERYRQTVAELRGGAITAKVSVRIGGKSLGKDRTAHVAAYINKILIVKRGELQEAPPSGGGIAAFLG